MLRLEVLGSVQVLLHGKPVSLGVKPLALLVYLALEGRTNRRALGALIWDDAPNPLNNVSVAKNQLEKALGDVLDADVDSLALKSFSCDALEFHASHPDSWALWRGGFFTGLRLAGWEKQLSDAWQDWLYATRSRLTAERQKLAVHLAEAQIATGQLEAALEFLEVATSGDEPLEDAATKQILVLGALGRAQAALEVFTRLARLLREELGVEPMPETLAALEFARADAVACKAKLGARVISTVPSAKADVPFVGRDSQTQQLGTFLQSAPARVAIIEGEPGAGKTRLALEILEQSNLRFWHLECLHGALSGATLASLVTQLGSLDALPADSRSALERLLGLRDAKESLPPDLEQKAIFLGIRALLVQTAPKVALLFDDLQWADDLTLRFLGWCFAEPMPLEQFCVLITLRNTESARGDVPNVLADFARRGISTRLALPALEMEAVQTLATQFGKTTDAATLYNASGGNPFYLLELLRSPDGKGRIAELIRARLEGLGSVAQQMLEALCIVGSNASVALLRAVSGRSLDEEHDALVTLTAAALLHTTDTVRFAHDLVRESIETQLSAARAQLLHLRAARASQPVEAATHYWAAREAWLETDTNNAIQAFLELGTRQGYRGEREPALIWFERALEHCPDTMRATVMIEQASLLERFGDYQAAMQQLADAEWWLETDLQKAKVLVARGFILQRELRDFTGAEQALLEAQKLLAGQKNRETLLIYGDAVHLLGTVAFQQKKYTEALEHYQTAYKLRQNLRDNMRLAESLSGLGSVCISLNDTRAEKFILESIKLRRELGDLIRVTRSLTNLTALYHQQGKIEAALSAQREALDTQYHIGNSTDIAISLNNLGVFLFDAGDIVAAADHYRQAIEIMQKNQLEPRVDFLANLAEAEAILAQDL